MVSFSFFSFKFVRCCPSVFCYFLFFIIIHFLYTMFPICIYVYQDPSGMSMCVARAHFYLFWYVWFFPRIVSRSGKKVFYLGVSMRCAMIFYLSVMDHSFSSAACWCCCFILCCLFSFVPFDYTENNIIHHTLPINSIPMANATTVVFK